MTAHQFTASTTIDDVVHADPALSRVLNAHGIDTCCGGSATLAEAADVRGMPLADLLAALNGEPEAAAPPAASAAPAPAGRPALTLDAARYVPFFIASLFFALTFGSTLGALTLASITLPWNFLAGISVASAKVAHGYAQVFGFATLFIMGVAYHTMPRFKATPLAAPRAASASFWLQTGGVIVTVSGILAGPPVTRPLWLMGSGALVAAALAFGWTVDRTLAGGAPAPERFERYLRAGCGWLIVASTLSLATAAGVAPLQGAAWEAALYGFAASWIFGMSLRILAVFMGLSASPARSSTTLFAGYQAAVVVWVTAAVVDAWTLVPVLRAIGGAALAVTAAVFVLRLGVLTRGDEQVEVGDRGYERFIVSAFVWLLIALYFAPGWSAVAALRGGATPSLLLDFGRHAFSLGFLAQVIIGVASRIVPVFSGAPLWSRAWREATFYLLNAAVVTRALEAVVELAGWAEVWPYIALSGVLGVGAFFAFTLNLMMTMRTRPRAAASAPVARLAGAPTADNLMAELFTIPGAVDLLVHRGLRALHDPARRAAIGQTVTLRQACRMHGIDVEPLVAELRELARRDA